MNVFEKVKKKYEEMKTEKAAEKAAYKEVYNKEKIEAIKEKAKVDAYASQGFERKSALKPLKANAGASSGSRFQKYKEWVKRNQEDRKGQEAYKTGMFGSDTSQNPAGWKSDSRIRPRHTEEPRKTRKTKSKKVALPPQRQASPYNEMPPMFRY
jgi:hypothetical protein